MHYFPDKKLSGKFELVDISKILNSGLKKTSSHSEMSSCIEECLCRPPKATAENSVLVQIIYKI